MRIGIVGAGALGSVLGVLFFEADFDVVLIRRNRELVDHVKRHGLQLDGASGERFIRPQIEADPAAAGKVDLAVVAVKAYDTAGAVHAIGQILSHNGTILTLQNGVGNYEILNEAFPGQVLLGTTTNAALVLGPGRVRHTGVGQTHFGEWDGSKSERAQAVRSILEKIQVGPVHLVDNAVGCVWSKLIVNAAINAPATLIRVRNGDLPAQDSGKQLIDDIVSECLSIVNAKGIRLLFDDPAAQVGGVCEATAPNINSMYQDILAGRRTEIDFINGALAREGESLGIPVPTNRALTLLVKSLEMSAPKRVPDSA